MLYQFYRLYRIIWFRTTKNTIEDQHQQFDQDDGIMEISTSKLFLRYEKPDSSKFILSGINNQNDSIYVVLNKINKNYALELKRK